MGSARARELADAIDSLNLAVVQLVRGCSEEQWALTANDEGDVRSVGVIAHHIGHGYATALSWLEQALAGGEVQTGDLEEIDRANAEHASTYHDVGRETTIRLLERNCGRLTARVGALTDRELDGTAFHALAGRTLTVEGFARLGERHAAGHLATIRKVLDLEA